MSTLRDHIKSVLDTTDLTDPAAIAEAVATDSTAAMRKEWVDEILPAYVAEVMRAQRNRALNGSRGRRMPSASAKVRSTRDWWAKLMDARIAVGDSWKQIGDCTSDDLAVIIETRHDTARRVLAQADKYAEIRDLMARHGAATVRDLPADAATAETIRQVAA